MRYYRKRLFEQMHNNNNAHHRTDGAGKELAARRYCVRRVFEVLPGEDLGGASFRQVEDGLFHPLNLSALAENLLESEVFGHEKDAFTGATKEKDGWLEKCKDRGTLFLDEIGELRQTVQVKLLRVLEHRVFYRLGDNKKERSFQGKIIAATNRELEGKDMGCFREDFYHRLCSERIITPSLQMQLSESPEEIHELLPFIVKRITGDEDVDCVVAKVEDWLNKHVDRDYTWPGNFRELEQRVRSVIIEIRARQSSQRSNRRLKIWLPRLKIGSLRLLIWLLRSAAAQHSRKKNSIVATPMLFTSKQATT